MKENSIRFVPSQGGSEPIPTCLIQSRLFMYEHEWTYFKTAFSALSIGPSDETNPENNYI